MDIRQWSLADLKQGETAFVSDLTGRGAMRRRLQDLGLIQGTRVECVGVSPLGDPAAYLIRGAVIALRGRDAAQILVDSISHPAVLKSRQNASLTCRAGRAAE